MEEWRAGMRGEREGRGEGGGEVGGEYFRVAQNLGSKLWQPLHRGQVAVNSLRTTPIGQQKSNIFCVQLCGLMLSIHHCVS